MSISISCPYCRRPYRLKDKFAGKQVKCRDCHQEFAVPATLAPPRERSESGEPIYRHEQRTTQAELTFEATPFLPDIVRHIERTIGPAPMVFHEIISEDVHIDLHIVPPTHEEPSEKHPLGTDHFTVITSGLSSRPMNLPAGSSTSLRYAELMIALPAEWPGMLPDGSFDDDLMENEANWWPLYWLKQLARLPHVFSTYYAAGHTVPNEDPPLPYAANTELCCMLLWPPSLAPESSELMINDDICINFYALWPIYLEEMNLKLRQGVEPLLQKFDEIELFELIDIHRKNVCKKGLWPFSQ